MDAKQKTKANFDKNAESYDTGSSYKYPRDCHPHVLREIETGRYQSFLDLGCGTGVVLKALYDKNPAAQYVGLDISEKMLAIAEERLNPEISLMLGDAENLPYPDNSFDIVSCTESFHHYPDPQKALSEVRRVLKNGGRFILCDTWTIWPLRWILNVMFRFGNGGDVHVYSKREISSLFRAAGFRDVKWRIITYHAYICTGER
jgi:ubiquinone/menaquinone biosynthesis C-methylase UbiE